MKSYNKVFLTLTIGKALQVIISLASVRLLTEYLSQSEVGSYYLLLGLISCFSFTIFNPFGQYFSRHLLYWRETGNLFNATVVLVLLRFVLVGFSLLIAFVIYELLNYSSEYDKVAFLLLISISLLSGAHGVLLSAMNYLGDRVKFTLYAIVTVVFGLILSITFVNLFQSSALSWLYGVALSQLVFIYPLFKFLSRDGKFSCDAIIRKCKYISIKPILIFCLPISLTLFLQWGQNNLYRFIVENQFSIEALAYLAVGMSVATSIFKTIESLATQYFNPIYLREITGASKSSRAQAWNNLARYMLPIYFLLMVFVIVASPYLIKILVAEKFQDAYKYTIFGAVIEFFRVSTNIVYLVSQSEVKTNTTITPYSIGLLIIVFGLYISESINSVPFVLILSSFMVFVTLFISMKKLLAIKFPFFSIFKVMCFSTLFSIFYFVDETQSVLNTILILTGISTLLLIGVYTTLPKARRN